MNEPGGFDETIHLQLLLATFAGWTVAGGLIRGDFYEDLRLPHYDF